MQSKGEIGNVILCVLYVKIEERKGNKKTLKRNSVCRAHFAFDTKDKMNLQTDFV